MKRLSMLLAAALCMAAVSGCASSGTENDVYEDYTEPPVETEKADDPELDALTENTVNAVITLTDGREIELELYPDIAPKTVANFIKNVQEGFYSGTIFHRAIKGFVVWGGGYDAQYNPKTVSETVEGEFSENGIENKLSHTRGVISMARTSDYNSATTQFFIVVEDCAYNDGAYAAFGRVTDGMDVVDEIAETPHMDEPPAGLKDVPDELFEIESIEIETSKTESEDEEGRMNIS